MSVNYALEKLKDFQILKKIDKHIEIVGSTSAKLGSMNKNSRTAVKLVLQKYYSHVGITIVNNLSDLEILIAKKPDLVFLGMKFVPANASNGLNYPTANQDKIWISEYLAQHGILTTGSDSSAHQLEYNKPMAKERVLKAGLATSSFYVASGDHQLSPAQLPGTFPLFVKPTDRGGGAGIDSNSVVHNFDQLLEKIHSISNTFSTDSLIEQYLPGREFSVSIMKSELSESYTIMPIELIAPQNDKGSRILSSKVKSADEEEVFEISDINIRKDVCKLAIDVFIAIGARDYGRIDIRLDQNGQAQFLEANLIPSLINNYGSFPKAWAINTGLSYDKMLLKIVQLGFARSIKYYDLPDIAKNPNSIPLHQSEVII